jgi:hypothetical protein
MRSEEGTVLPLVGGLAIVAFIVLGLVTDVALLHGTYRRTALGADAAAEAGAAMLDPIAAHDGRVAISPTDAEAEARRVIEVSHLDLDLVGVEVSGDQLCIDVATTHRTVMLATLGLREVPVEVRSCAHAAVG